MHSNDEGRNWSWPRVLLDGAIDDRDSGIVETQRGTLLVTTFTSLAYEATLKKQLAQPTWEAARIARWKAAHDRISPDERKEELGEFLIRSTDGGVTWSEPYTHDCKQSARTRRAAGWTDALRGETTLDKRPESGCV
jgi:hypothetical protein